MCVLLYIQAFLILLLSFLFSEGTDVPLINTQNLFPIYAKDIYKSSERSNIETFKVMDVLGRAVELEQKGRDIMHMEAGQPGSGAPKRVIDKAVRALKDDPLGYTNSLGITLLRNEISEYYQRKYQTKIPPERIIITTGSSAAFLLLFLAAFDAGNSVALCSSGYPCYRNVLLATGLKPVSIPVNIQYKVTAIELSKEINRRIEQGESPLSGFIMSSPSNPTGAMLSPEELREVCELCSKHKILFISDEIYHGITYGTQKQATANLFSDKVAVVNSFSKYYSMTGNGKILFHKSVYLFIIDYAVLYDLYVKDGDWVGWLFQNI